MYKQEFVHPHWKISISQKGTETKAYRHFGIWGRGGGKEGDFLSENLHYARIGKSFKIHSSCMVFVKSCKSVRVENVSNGKHGYRLLVKIHFNATLQNL